MSSGKWFLRTLGGVRGRASLINLSGVRRRGIEGGSRRTWLDACLQKDSPVVQDPYTLTAPVLLRRIQTSLTSCVATSDMTSCSHREPSRRAYETTSSSPFHFPSICFEPPTLNYSVLLACWKKTNKGLLCVMHPYFLCGEWLEILSI